MRALRLERISRLLGTQIQIGGTEPHAGRVLVSLELAAPALAKVIAGSGLHFKQRIAIQTAAGDACAGTTSSPTDGALAIDVRLRANSRPGAVVHVVAHELVHALTSSLGWKWDRSSGVDEYVAERVSVELVRSLGLELPHKSYTLFVSASRAAYARLMAEMRAGDTETYYAWMKRLFIYRAYHLGANDAGAPAMWTAYSMPEPWALMAEVFVPLEAVRSTFRFDARYLAAAKAQVCDELLRRKALFALRTFPMFLCGESFIAPNDDGRWAVAA